MVATTDDEETQEKPVQSEESPEKLLQEPTVQVFTVVELSHKYCESEGWHGYTNVSHHVKYPRRKVNVVFDNFRAGKICTPSIVAQLVKIMSSTFC